MRGKDYNTGLRGVLFEAQHYERMGAALWLYGWLVLRQTHQQGNIGWVLGGSPVSYREIEEETGFNPRTLERWMHALRRHGYIQTEAAPTGVIVRIMKAKKLPQATRNSADTPRKFAGAAAQIWGANDRNPQRNHQAAARIGSSSLKGSKEKSATPDIHNNFHSKTLTPQQITYETNPRPNLSGLGQNPESQDGATPDFTAAPHFQTQQKFFQEARLRLQLLRAEREEAVRRELAVGGGPEVIRP
jgi:hypothetical protein